MTGHAASTVHMKITKPPKKESWYSHMLAWFCRRHQGGPSFLRFILSGRNSSLHFYGNPMIPNLWQIFLNVCIPKCNLTCLWIFSLCSYLTTAVNFQTRKQSNLTGWATVAHACFTVMQMPLTKKAAPKTITKWYGESFKYLGFKFGTSSLRHCLRSRWFISRTLCVLNWVYPTHNKTQGWKSPLG